MPFFKIKTNCEIDNKQNFLQDAAQFVASELHKPISYVIVTLEQNQDMIFGGDVSIKSALVELDSIGFSEKKILAQKLTDFLCQKLSANASYLNIHFVNMAASDLSINGQLLG